MNRVMAAMNSSVRSSSETSSSRGRSALSTGGTRRRAAAMAAPEKPTCAGQQHRLGHELAQQARRGGTQGEPDGGLVESIELAHQRQERHVGAGYEQDQADRSQQYPEHGGRVAHDFDSERREADAPAAIGLGILDAQVASNAVQLILLPGRSTRGI